MILIPYTYFFFLFFVLFLPSLFLFISFKKRDGEPLFRILFPSLTGNMILIKWHFLSEPEFSVCKNVDNATFPYSFTDFC